MMMGGDLGGRAACSRRGAGRLIVPPAAPGRDHPIAAGQGPVSRAAATPPSTPPPGFVHCRFPAYSGCPRTTGPSVITRVNPEGWAFFLAGGNEHYHRPVFLRALGRSDEREAAHHQHHD